MAETGSIQYYISSRTKPKLSGTLDTSVQNEQRWSESVFNDSIYIFPDPPSAPASPSQCSDVSTSTHTNMTISWVGSPDEPRTLAFSNPYLLLPLTPLEGTEHPERSQSYTNDVSQRDVNKNIVWPDLKKDVTARWRAQRSIEPSSPPLRALHLALSESIEKTGPDCQQIPLLSFFASLLAVDDITFNLLSSSPRSALFPELPLPSDIAQIDEVDHEIHGVEKLLTRLGTSRARAVKNDRASASDSSLTPYSPFSSLIGLWSLVTDLMGAQPLRAVLQR